VLERIARDEHSSLLRTVVNYDRKEFYNIGRTGLKDLKEEKFGHDDEKSLIAAAVVLRSVTFWQKPLDRQANATTLSSITNKR
jgi:hypothetical protein